MKDRGTLMDSNFTATQLLRVILNIPTSRWKSDHLFVGPFS
jgi:hypothetical protein